MPELRSASCTPRSSRRGHLKKREFMYATARSPLYRATTTFWFWRVACRIIWHKSKNGGRERAEVSVGDVKH